MVMSLKSKLKYLNSGLRPWAISYSFDTAYFTKYINDFEWVCADILYFSISLEIDLGSSIEAIKLLITTVPD